MGYYTYYTFSVPGNVEKARAIIADFRENCSCAEDFLNEDGAQKTVENGMGTRKI